MAELAETVDDIRCRWPDCTCYSPQGPNKCRRITEAGLKALGARP